VFIRKDKTIPTYDGQYSVLIQDVAQARSVPEGDVETLELSGDWQVEFDPKWGGPGRVTLKSLIDWKDHEQTGIKHFSGTAHYTHSFIVQPSDLETERPIYLDLGAVEQIAEVSVNGKKLATLWKPPFAVDIRSEIKPGLNTLKIDVTNTWVNRLIGDEYLPDTSGYKMTGDTVAWINNNEAPPDSERVTFTGFNFFAKEEKRVLQTSGLLGPVTIVRAAE